MGNPPPIAPKPLGDDSLQAIPYDETQAAEPPIPVRSTSAPYKINSYARRDSGLAPSTLATVRNSRTSSATDADSVPSPKIAPSLPTASTPEDSPLTLPKTTRRWGTRKGRAQEGNGLISPSLQTPFEKIATEIPTGGLDDLTTPGHIEFSNRGSMLLSGKKINQANGHLLSHSRKIGSRSLQNLSVTSPSSTISTRVISTDEEMLSQKVRSMYEAGVDGDSHVPDQSNAPGGIYPKGSQRRPGEACSPSPHAKSTSDRNISADRNLGETQTVRSERGSLRDEYELAGGMENWEDLDGFEVNRYGFIEPKRLPSPGSGQAVTVEHQRVQRVTTSLQVASEAPRRHRSTVRRKASTARSTTTPANSSSRSLRPPSRNSQHGSLGGVPSKIRNATNRLPHNKDRRALDEAADMLTLPPGLADIAEGVCIKAAAETKRKEWEREEKWRKMAKVVNQRRDGGGMIFEFDTSNPKLIERAWKGIPDRWRATAWHAFLTASAKKRSDSLTDEDLIATFHTLVEQCSPDDVQIDLDVPRTINSHIMFRRRYRGGQRLLFRVLHCLSIYFPETGYVQGMATLAATLLCYFDEGMAFVMLVRLWQLRGLERLYQSEFEGLMQALEEFENGWLGEREIAVKLVRSSQWHVWCRWQANWDMICLEKSQRVSHVVRHSLVPHPFQLLYSLSCAAPRLGRFHASG